MYINIIHIFSRSSKHKTLKKKRQHEQPPDPENVRFNIECKAHEKRVK